MGKASVPRDIWHLCILGHPKIAIKLDLKHLSENGDGLPILALHWWHNNWRLSRQPKSPSAKFIITLDLYWPLDESQRYKSHISEAIRGHLEWINLYCFCIIPNFKLWQQTYLLSAVAIGTFISCKPICISLGFKTTLQTQWCASRRLSVSLAPMGLSPYYDPTAATT